MPMKTTTELFLSRNFVEFGPFTADELSGFSTRGILLEGDFIKEAGSEAWQPCMEWLSSLNGDAPKVPAPAKKAPVKKKTAKPRE